MIALTPCRHRALLEPCTLPKRNFQVDPYIGCEHYCYYCYVLPQAETDWRKEILFHENIVGRLEAELAAIPPQTVYMGWHTDPYQPCETDCRQTRQVLELLLDKGFSASILTKSDLVLRDMDILRSMKDATVSVSVAFDDGLVRQMFEANTRETKARLSALQKMKSAGVKTAALICPVVPYISDVTLLIDELTGHADTIWVYGLSIQNRSDINWQNVERILESQFPDLAGEIQSAVFSETHAYWGRLRRELIGLKTERRLNMNIHI